MFYFLIFVLQASCQSIYSLQEKTICELPDSCSQERKQHNYGIERVGDLTNTPFYLQLLFQVNGKLKQFIASINDGSAQLVNITIENYVFNITNSNSYYISQNFSTPSIWYQLIITERQILICYEQIYSSTIHNQSISSSTRFNFLDSSIDTRAIVACCIMFYKGITYPNSRQITFYNTKQPEVIIDLNIQEKVQSNITLDYSDYKYIVKLGDLFDYDQYDPFLQDDGLLFNASQYLQINQITINYQFTFEFRLYVPSNLSSNILLLNYTNSYELYIYVNDSYITYSIQGNQKSFQYQYLPFLHFCIGVIQQKVSNQLIWFIQFSDMDIIQIQKSQISFYYYDNDTSNLHIGSKSNQIGYFILFHFRYYQGFFIDDQSVMEPNCQIYLNDRCIICKQGYILTNNHNCALQCDSSTYTTFLVQSHNQCQRQCHPTCATCNQVSPSICLTCYGLRTLPPNCYCPIHYFEDYVSPNCRSIQSKIQIKEYYPDTSIQSGTLYYQCTSQIAGPVNFRIAYKIPPQVIVSFIGTSTIYNISKYRVYYTVNVTASSFKIPIQCHYSNQVYVINWLSSVGNNIIQSNYLKGDIANQSQLPYISQDIIVNGIQLNPIHQIYGWDYLNSSTKIQLQIIQTNSTSIYFDASPNVFRLLWRNYFYTLFKSYDLSNETLDSQLDDQPKSIQSIIIQRGFSIDSYYRFIYYPDKRNSTYFSIKSVFNKTMQIYNWSVIMASQSCNNNSGPCDFYDSYIFNCNKQFSFCLENTKNERYFLNESSYNYQECDDSCKTCIGNSSNCTSCFTDQNMTLKNNRCPYNCDPNCLECSPLQNTTCTQCVPFATLNLIYNKCYCDIGYYFDSVSYLCLECSKQCLTCDQSSNNCTSCYDIAYLIGTQCIIMEYSYLDENNSTQRCTRNCKTCKSNFKCTSCVNDALIFGTGQCYCPLGYYLDELLKCSPCMRHCLDCRTISTCLKCSPDKVYSNNSCTCDLSKYQDSGEICQICNINCRTCFGPLENQCFDCHFDRQLTDANNCKCNEGYYCVQDRQECKQCPANCVQCLNPSECTQCGHNLTVKNGYCECSQGFYKQDDQCQSCDTKIGKYILECNYRNFQDKIYTPSEECDDGNLVSYDGCTNCKIDFNYQCYNQVDKVSICYQCQNYCNSCSVENDQIICQKCNDGYFLSENQCILCSKNCNTCTSFKQCKKCSILNSEPDELSVCPECDFGYYLQIDQCAPKCGDGIKTDDEFCDDGNINSADGCDNNCNIEDSLFCNTAQHLSTCFRSYKPQFILNELIKISNSQYKIQIVSDQQVQFLKFDVQVRLRDDSQYNYTYDVQSNKKMQHYSKLEINITINLSVSTRQQIFQIKISGDIHNQYGQTLDDVVFTQYFQNIYIFQPLQLQSSEVLSDLGGKLFYVSFSLSVLQLFVSEITDSVSFFMKTQNYLLYIKYINIDYPPNIIYLFNQFADSNVLQFLNFPSISGRIFGYNLSLDQFFINKPSTLNHLQVSINFFVNIYLYLYTMVQVFYSLSYCYSQLRRSNYRQNFKCQAKMQLIQKILSY